MTSKFNRITLIIALAAVGGSVLAQDAAPVLRLKVEPGTKLGLTTKSETKMSFAGMMEQTVNSTTTLGQSLVFQQGEGGWLKFEILTTEFSMESDGQMGPMPVDPATIGEQLKKTKIIGEVDERGQSRGVTLSNAEELDQMGKSILTSTVASTAQLGFMGVAFPEEGLTVGQTWDKEFDMAQIVEDNSMGFLSNVQGKIPVKFEVAGFEDVSGSRTVKIKSFMDGSVTFDVSMMGSQGNMNMTSVGHVWIDLATGLVVKAETEMANTMDMGQLTIQQETKVSTAVRKV
jgi:hypothetical protein